MEKIKGIVYFYDPTSKTMKDMEIEASVEVAWEEIEWGKNEITFLAYPWALARCPYDGEKLGFDISFADNTDDDYPTETSPAGECIHFAPSDFNCEIDKIDINTTEAGIIYVEETKKKFADRMGLEVQWWGAPGNEYYVFVEKAEE